MADADITTRPAFATKDAMIKEIRLQIEPNCPNMYDLLVRIAHTDATGLSDGATLTKASFGL